jgi:D-beta-D-heptose 7-phosphate kinase/D-beta-D-heptose 1-phosphate adenosyltransferase
LLEFCASLGEVVIGINSDESVSKLKGPTRPINSAESRRYILQSLVYVKEVHIFDEDTPRELISKLNPDIVVKGGDYIKSEVVTSENAEVVIFPFLEGFSTTRLINQISIQANEKEVR